MVDGYNIRVSFSHILIKLKALKKDLKIWKPQMRRYLILFANDTLIFYDASQEQLTYLG